MFLRLLFKPQLVPITRKALEQNTEIENQLTFLKLSNMLPIILCIILTP